MLSNQDDFTEAKKKKRNGASYNKENIPQCGSSLQS